MWKQKLGCAICRSAINPLIDNLSAFQLPGCCVRIRLSESPRPDILLVTRRWQCSLAYTLSTHSAIFSVSINIYTASNRLRSLTLDLVVNALSNVVWFTAKIKTSCDAMHKRRERLCRGAVSVRPSITFVDSVETNKHIFKILCMRSLASHLSSSRHTKYVRQSVFWNGRRPHSFY